MAASSWYPQDVVRLDIARRLIQVARGVINSTLSDERFLDDTSFFDLGLASLNVVELLSAVEQEFDVVVDGEELSAELFMRFGNVVSFVEKKLRQSR